MNSDKRADFSAVTVKVDSTAEVAPKADFSAVQVHVDSTAEQVQQVYVVKQGDSLSKIAKLHYGDGNAWVRIFEANRDVLDDPDKLYPGQTLKLPARA
ncbi:LysM peptidoglycan-binding domain-containing protein [Xanthomonas theicola]|uniref:Peptidoglycan-binding protein LysM n=1 Tax=Xanthomonas theicola TaxID=56464 RepID=A0A2S6ZD43_9XANT|nr:LysM peptidoglycan-binding domain-containing protein [Xanthomonas theicola]PPT89222.1 peptidoglycan-binding protein LysM [Xanthomonas theicola]QNH26537.1 LysM peptidoglycan-binding domain-containing protein [Xanthomonas theicola]